MSPFERFYLGGVFLSGFVLDGREILNLRGYDDLSLTAPDRNTGAPVVAKYSAELRYPLSTNPSATIYTLAFLEGGNTWEDPRAFNPFQVYRSAGLGMRIFLPMFGLLDSTTGGVWMTCPPIPNMAREPVPLLHWHEHGRTLMKLSVLAPNLTRHPTDDNKHTILPTHLAQMGH